MGLVGFVMFHDDSFGQGKTVRQSGSALDECFRATARVYDDLYGEAYRRLELEYRGHDRPADWRYAGSARYCHQVFFIKLLRRQHSETRFSRRATDDVAPYGYHDRWPPRSRARIATRSA